MKSAYIETAKGLGIALSLFFGGFLLAGFIENPLTDAGDMATWAGAFGTFLAFAGTIWIATSESRRRQRAERLTGLLVAASFTLRLTVAHGIVKTVSEILDDRARVDVGPMPFARMAEVMTEIDLWSVDDLIPLVNMPNQLAINLAQTMGHIRTTIDEFLVIPKAPRTYDGPARQDLARKASETLASTSLMLTASIDECRSATEVLLQGRGIFHTASTK